MARELTPYDLISDLAEQLERYDERKAQLDETRAKIDTLSDRLMPIVPRGEVLHVRTGRSYAPVVLRLAHDGLHGITASLLSTVHDISLQWPEPTEPATEPTPEPAHTVNPDFPTDLMREMAIATSLAEIDERTC